MTRFLDSTLRGAPATPPLLENWGYGRRPSRARSNRDRTRSHAAPVLRPNHPVETLTASRGWIALGNVRRIFPLVQTRPPSRNAAVKPHAEGAQPLPARPPLFFIGSPCCHNATPYQELLGTSAPLAIGGPYHSLHSTHRLDYSQIIPCFIAKVSCRTRYQNST